MQQTKLDKAIVWWLASGVILILAMVIIGGITKLTGSGLSIVEWNVISGALPPLNEASWVVAFEKYKQFPEFQKLKSHMDLAGFKQIFWWEYLNRLLGRTIGIVFLVPFLYFFYKNQLKGRLLRRLLLVLALGMGQGLMGWFMVMSGLVDNPHVSHFRLAAHLSLALSLIGTILWTMADLVDKNTDKVRVRYSPIALFTFALVLLQIVLGAFVAGLKAGYSYNTFPLMNGEIIPSAVIKYLNWATILENGAFIQFVHRWVAFAVLGMVTITWLRCRKSGKTSVKQLATAIMIVSVLQVSLGIATLLMGIPLLLGVLHQAVAVVLFSLSVLLVHQTRQAVEKPTFVKQLRVR